jgi:hypothetical protein
VPYSEYPSIGPFEGDQFDPAAWKPQTPVTAYVDLRADDAFWAARRVMAFTDDLIRAAVRTGQFSDPVAERHLAAVLAKRRDAIGRAYLTAINPIVDPVLEADGTLSFTNAAVEADFARAPRSYRAEWFRFDNATSHSERIGETVSRATEIAAPGPLPTSDGAFVHVKVSSVGGLTPAWETPVNMFFRYSDGLWQLVGFERMPS